MPNPGSFILGLLFLLGGTIGCFMLAGHSPASLFYLVPSLAMVLIPLGCCSMAFGLRGPAVLFRSFAAILGLERADAPEATRVISACIGYVYGAGAFVLLASLLSIMACFPDFAASGLSGSFGRNVAATTASLMYPVVLAELVLRPMKRRLA